MKKLIKKDESDFIDEIRNLIPEYISFFKEKKDQQIYLNISDDDADKFRDFLIEKQQDIGFDINYNLTQKGKVLEKLIDKLFL